MGQDGFVRIAIGVINGAGVLLELEPWQQSLGLRMIGDSVNRDRERGIGKVFDYVAIFHDVLALSGRILPEGSDVVDPVEANKGIIKRLRDFVAVRGYILEAAAKETGTYPTGIIQDEEPWQVAIVRQVDGIAGLKVEGMETKDAAVAGISDEQKSVREKEGGNIPGGNIARDFSLTDDGRVVRPGRALREQFIIESCGIDQNETAAAAVGVERELISPAEQDHGFRWLHAGVEQRMPVWLRLVPVLGALDGVRNLCWDRAAAVSCIGEYRPIQEWLNKRRHIKKQALPIHKARRPVSIAQVERNRDHGSIDDGSAAFVRRISDDTEFPDVMSAAVEQHSLGFKMVGEIHQRIYTQRETVRGRDISLLVSIGGIVRMQNMQSGVGEIGRQGIIVLRKRCKAEAAQRD